MQIETLAQDGYIQIQNVGYFAKADLANAASAEKEWTRQSLYSGPPFGNLDEDLQTLMEQYLEERGVDNALAVFVPEYIEFKEQQEYIRWLRSKFLRPNNYMYLDIADEPGLTSSPLSFHYRPQEFHRGIDGENPSLSVSPSYRPTPPLFPVNMPPPFPQHLQEPLFRLLIPSTSSM